MDIYLNFEQAKGLAGFFFDVAKGLVLGGFGLTITAPVEVKLFTAIFSSFIAVWCIKTALFFLKEVK